MIRAVRTRAASVFICSTVSNSAALAQSAEHLTRNEKVKGSIPLGGSG